MPAIIVPNGAPSLGPGYLFRMPLATTGPSNTVANSVFSDAWPAACIPIGITRDGTTFSYETTTEDVVVAEYLDPLMTVPTGRNIGATFDLANITNKAYLLAMNGGTSVTTGSGATSMTTVEPPALGEEVRTMLGWESQDGTQRIILRQNIQSGQVQWSAKKAPDFQSFPLSFKTEQPAGGVKPISIYLAGANRVLTQ